MIPSCQWLRVAAGALVLPAAVIAFGLDWSLAADRGQGRRGGGGISAEDAAIGIGAAILTEALRRQQLRRAQEAAQQKPKACKPPLVYSRKSGRCVRLAAPAAPAQTSSEIEVAELQKCLVEAGYDPGPADGRMGRKTREALAAYLHELRQKDAGQVPSADESGAPAWALKACQEAAGSLETARAAEAISVEPCPANGAALTLPGTSLMLLNQDLERALADIQKTPVLRTILEAFDAAIDHATKNCAGWKEIKEEEKKALRDRFIGYLYEYRARDWIKKLPQYIQSCQFESVEAAHVFLFVSETQFELAAQESEQARPEKDIQDKSVVRTLNAFDDHLSDLIRNIEQNVEQRRKMNEAVLKLADDVETLSAAGAKLTDAPFNYPDQFLAGIIEGLKCQAIDTIKSVLGLEVLEIKDKVLGLRDYLELFKKLSDQDDFRNLVLEKAKEIKDRSDREVAKALGKKAVEAYFEAKEKLTEKVEKKDE